MLRTVLAISFAAATAALIGTMPASALSLKECSTKFQAAKDAGTLNGKAWGDFRKAECGADATVEPAAAPAKPDKAAKKKKADTTEAAAPAKADTKKAKKAEVAAVDDSAGKLTAKECSAKYQDAKANELLNGMKWNDFRKAMCGSDAAAAEPAPVAKKAKKVVMADDSNAASVSKLSAKECSALYQDAKSADALDGMKWNDFRKAKCGSDAAAVEPADLPKKVAKADAMPVAAHLSAKDCSAKYQAAKSDGTLGGKKWNDFRKSDCTTDAQDEPDVMDVTADSDPVEPALVSTAKAPKGVKFPRSVSADYADLSAGRARMRTCVDAYHINKDNGTLNGLKWIQKGGGFYSLCNTKLKGL